MHTVSFKAYDLDGNGYITKDELGTMFKHAWIAGFKALCTTTGNEELSMEDLHQFSEEMANLFADNAFETLDTNGTSTTPRNTTPQHHNPRTPHSLTKNDVPCR